MMNQKIFACMVVFLLSVSFVAASVGGGSAGGSGGAAGGGFSIGITSSSSSGSSSNSGGEGPYFYGLNCFDNGQITFKQKPAIKPVVVEKNGLTFTVAGEWDGTIFTSEEAEINGAGTYTIYDSKNGDKSVVCPGLAFSCRLVELDLQEFFYEEGKITVTFSLSGKGTSLEDLQFQFQKEDSLQILKYQKGALVSSELKDIKIQKTEGINTYRLEIADAPRVSSLKVVYPECTGKYYVSSKIDLMEREEPVLLEGELQKPSQISVAEGPEETLKEKPISILKRISLFVKGLFL